MEATTNITDQLITRSYEEYHSTILGYITYRINNHCDAEDLTQDVFVRLLDYKQMLRPDTVRFFLFSIARNLIIDYLRRHYKKQEINSYLYNFMERSSNDTENEILARDLQICEKRLLRLLPVQRRKVYELSRFEEKSAIDISVEMNLSRRTVENHLFISRREMREYMMQCI